MAQKAICLTKVRPFILIESDLLTYVKGRLSTAIAALTLAFARSCGRNLINDDILIIVQQQLNPGR